MGQENLGKGGSSRPDPFHGHGLNAIGTRKANSQNLQVSMFIRMSGIEAFQDAGENALEV